MWLLDTSTIELKYFIGRNIPPYAILSHTWGEDEVSFTEIFKKKDSTLDRSGYAKVEGCCRLARQQGFNYAWVDSCSIDKRSSAELSEAINSMFKWYQKAEVTYVYLADVPSDQSDPERFLKSLLESRWFTRGWTLQELLAPYYIEFYAQDWLLIGKKDARDPDSIFSSRSSTAFLSALANITGIEERVLLNPNSVHNVPIAARMSWAAQRETTREEDMAYSLMGLFGVHIPILYGEGENNAFKRLQLEIMRSSGDTSIFAWRADRIYSGLLAQSPRDFTGSAIIGVVTVVDTITPYSNTNQGLSITPRTVLQYPNDDLVAMLDCAAFQDGKCYYVGLYLKILARQQIGPSGKEILVCRRADCGELVLTEQVSGPEVASKHSHDYRELLVRDDFCW